MEPDENSSAPNYAYFKVETEASSSDGEPVARFCAKSPTMLACPWHPEYDRIQGTLAILCGRFAATVAANYR